jgi:hypothetical protein
MEPTDQLQVNLTSQEDIRAKLPEARRIYKAKADALRALRREVENWTKLVELLAQLAGEPDTVETPDGGADTTRAQTRATKKESPAQDRAIAALQRAGKPMGPTALYRFMEHQDLQLPKNPNALGAALWNAMENGRLKKTPLGLYALLEWETDQPELEDASRNGAQSGDASGLSENGDGEPLSTATHPQEGTQE